MRERTTWRREEIIGSAPYESSNPDTWADRVLPDDWEREAADARRALLIKRGDLAVKVARMMLGPEARESVVEDQAVALMALPDSDLIETFCRLEDR